MLFADSTRRRRRRPPSGPTARCVPNPTMPVRLPAACRPRIRPQPFPPLRDRDAPPSETPAGQPNSQSDSVRRVRGARRRRRIPPRADRAPATGRGGAEGHQARSPPILRRSAAAPRRGRSKAVAIRCHGPTKAAPSDSAATPPARQRLPAYSQGASWETAKCAWATRPCREKWSLQRGATSPLWSKSRPARTPRRRSTATRATTECSANFSPLGRHS